MDRISKEAKLSAEHVTPTAEPIRIEFRIYPTFPKTSPSQGYFPREPTTMPPKLRAAVRSSLVSSSLAAEKGGRKGGIVFCPSCSTCRKRTLSTVAITPASTATLTSTSCRTRNAGCSSSSSSSKNNSVSKEFFGNGSSVSATVRRYLSSSISSNGTVGIGGVGVDNISSSSSSRKSSNVPPHLRELYAALHEIQQVAADHVSLSRLQLAQRGLESEDPVIRVAGKLDH